MFCIIIIIILFSETGSSQLICVNHHCLVCNIREHFLIYNVYGFKQPGMLSLVLGKWWWHCFHIIFEFLKADVGNSNNSDFLTQNHPTYIFLSWILVSPSIEYSLISKFLSESLESRFLDELLLLLLLLLPLLLFNVFMKHFDLELKLKLYFELMILSSFWGDLSLTVGQEITTTPGWKILLRPIELCFSSSFPYL